MKRLLPLLLIALLIFPVVSMADELDDTTKALNQKQQELQNAKQSLEAAKKKESELAGGLSPLQASLNTAIAQVKVKEAEVAKILAELDRQEVQLEEQQALRDIRIREFYKRLSSEKANQVVNLLDANNLVSFAKVSEYQSQLLDEEERIILDLNKKVEQIDQKRAELQKELDNLAEERRLAQQKVDNLQYQINLAKNQQYSANSQINNLGNEIQFLDSKLKQLLDAELAKMNANQQTNRKPLAEGEYFFMGRGRDLVEGHGLGMSQWGAFGMAQKGWNHKDILTFYYPGTNIGKYNEPQKIYINDCGNPCKGTPNPMPFDTYLAGIGEMVDSWPAEAVRAQVVAARTYVMRAGHDMGGGVRSICSSQACQVYKGGTAKMSHVTATKGEVILYQGSPIVAYYSASHRGYSTSLNSAWGSSDLPYIKPVNDDAYAYKNYYTSDPYNPGEIIYPYYWQWRTNGYSLAELTNIFSRDSRLNVGNVKNIIITKDAPQKRVARITLIGDAGTKTLTGWSFRAIFNSATPYDDYLYSTEFSFQQKR